jgi:hypothetical protein
MANSQKVQSLDEVLLLLSRLPQAQTVQSSNGWTVNALFEHLAQSIEMSMQGYPQSKGAWFQATLGSAAFYVFKMRGSMTHGLSEPIPGAPALQQLQTWQSGAARLHAAIVRFQNYQGALQPHFAYGALSHADYALAHTMHFANHQDKMLIT